MADWVSNEMIVSGGEARLKEFMEEARQPHPVGIEGEGGMWRMQSEDEASDLSFWSAIAPTELEEYFSLPGPPSYPAPNVRPNAARPWNIENWGTKWDALRVEVEDAKEYGYVNYLFETAYSPPLPYFEALVAKWPDLSFQISWDGPYGEGAELEGENGVLEEVDIREGDVY